MILTGDSWEILTGLTPDRLVGVVERVYVVLTGAAHTTGSEYMFVQDVTKSCDDVT